MAQNINEFLFGRTKAEKKLETIKSMTDREIRCTSAQTILRIYKECRGKDNDGKPYDRFYINPDRRAGNNWDSTIEFIYEYKGEPWLMLYVQNCSTDSSTAVSYLNFVNSTSYKGYNNTLRKYFTYGSESIVNVIRCILMEYVYWKYIERAERERREQIGKLLDWRIYNPVCNQFYEEWRCRYESGGWNCKTPRTDRYHRAEKAVKNYVEVHADELIGKPTEELQNIYRKIFRETD